ncbi:glycine oxidase ThiO [Rhodococcus sp. D2-41]|uniref:glycine oxidase n=1 Tax=Speluncibacter jeojiensis TaxID=2710754 RepID=A0A9X4M3A6_9ACTN|nr:glycine oxidase ThiO [Rhodococcus sp. D2-41]MDG3010056.1 glycine oxidase ThiO [Rhodococcus sp. D2-41]MDG3016240.1 glycine oxidase ThiO [Corynebacteriales bacterium D3-21]
MRVHTGKRLTVVGAGVIGASVAWLAAREGWQVELIDPLLAEGAEQTGASWAAGGMLAPFSEAWPGEDDVFELGAASLRRWPDFGARLRDETGVDVFTGTGTLLVAVDGADIERLTMVADWLTTHGYRPQRLTRTQVREEVPSLSRSVRGGLLVPEELSVDNRALLPALRRAAEAAGARLSARELTSIDECGGDQVVLAAGSDSPRLWPGLPVHPAKGEILRLRRRPGTPPLPTRIVRGLVHGRHVYLVPRDGGMVVGATQHEGHDQQVTVGGVRDLIADAEALLPSIGEYQLADAMAGLRPMSPDNLPLIGRLSDRVVAATGHGRNGVLLTAVTVDAVLAELDGGQLADAKAADPGRF